MSIIYDALKKVEDTQTKNKPQQNPQGKPNYLLTVVFIAVCLGGAGYFLLKTGKLPDISKIFNRPAAQKAGSSRTSAGVSRPASSASARSTSQPAAAKPAGQTKSPAQPPKTYKRGEYALEGIMYDKDAKIAVINGQMYRAGETIGDYRVEEVAPKSVKLINTKDNSVLDLSL